MDTAPSGDRAPTPAPRSRTERRGELLDAADQVIRRDGPSASMERIAAEAGITKPILYRHFGDKGELYRCLAERYVEPVMDALRPALQWTDAQGPEQLAAGIDTYLSFIEGEPQIYRFLMHRALSEEQEARAMVSDFTLQVGREIAAVIRAELEGRDMDSGPAEAWGHAVVGMVQVAGDWWLQEQTVSRTTLVDHLVTLAWYGLSVTTEG